MTQVSSQTLKARTPGSQLTLAESEIIHCTATNYAYVDLLRLGSVKRISVGDFSPPVVRERPYNPP